MRDVILFTMGFAAAVLLKGRLRELLGVSPLLEFLIIVGGVYITAFLLFHFKLL